MTYQEREIDPVYIPGPSQRADAQTKILAGQALKKVQQDINLHNIVTGVIGIIRMLADPNKTGQVPNVQRAAECREGQEGHQDQEGAYRQLSGWCSPIIEGPHEASGSGSQFGVSHEVGVRRSSHDVSDTGCRRKGVLVWPAWSQAPDSYDLQLYS